MLVRKLYLFPHLSSSGEKTVPVRPDDGILSPTWWGHFIALPAWNKKDDRWTRRSTPQRPERPSPPDRHRQRPEPVSTRCNRQIPPTASIPSTARCPRLSFFPKATSLHGSRLLIVEKMFILSQEYSILYLLSAGVVNTERPFFRPHGGESVAGYPLDCDSMENRLRLPRSYANKTMLHIILGNAHGSLKRKGTFSRGAGFC